MRVFSLRHRFSNGVVGLDRSGVGLGLTKKLRSWTYVQKGKVPVLSLEANSVYDKNLPLSKNCSALTVWWGHMCIKKEECIPGLNPGFNRKGVIGPFTVEILFVLHVLRNESRVG